MPQGTLPRPADFPKVPLSCPRAGKKCPRAGKKCPRAHCPGRPISRMCCPKPVLSCPQSIMSCPKSIMSCPKSIMPCPRQDRMRPRTDFPPQKGKGNIDTPPLKRTPLQRSSVCGDPPVQLLLPGDRLTGPRGAPVQLLLFSQPAH